MTDTADKKTALFLSEGQPNTNIFGNTLQLSFSQKTKQKNMSAVYEVRANGSVFSKVCLSSEVCLSFDRDG